MPTPICHSCFAVVVAIFAHNKCEFHCLAETEPLLPHDYTRIELAATRRPIVVVVLVPVAVVGCLEFLEVEHN